MAQIIDDNTSIFRISDDTEITPEVLQKYIQKHDQRVNGRLGDLLNAYNNQYAILTDDGVGKATWKPNVKVAANLAAYVVNTFEGFFLGVPIKISSEDETVTDTISTIRDANDAEDVDADVSTWCDIFGNAYEIIYIDEDGPGMAAVSPVEGFMIYNESIKPKPRCFVRVYTDSDNVKRGSISDETTVRYFNLKSGQPAFEEEHPHGFDGVPAVEYVLKSNRRGLFEDVLNLINEFNKALSEKGNDVQSFANAIMKVLGAELSNDELQTLRDYLIINFTGPDGAKVDVDFLQKPAADGLQENLLNRLQDLIFMICMVCNISDDKFATSSGIALKYKMLPMINMAAAKWRKFQASQSRLWKLMCSNPAVSLSEDDWVSLKYTHVLNYPANVQEEASIASELSGITSKRTQLSVLSIVDNVDDEMDQIAKEEDEREEYVTDRPTDRTVNDNEEEKDDSGSEDAEQVSDGARNGDKK